MPLAVTVHLIPVKFMCGTLSIAMRSDDRYPAAAIVIQSVRTMKPASGVTGNLTNYIVINPTTKLKSI